MISRLRHPKPSYDQSRNHLGDGMYVSSYAIKKSSLPREKRRQEDRHFIGKNVAVLPRRRSVVIQSVGCFL